MELAKEKRGRFLYRLICPKEIFFNIYVLSQRAVYWIHFQNTHTFTYFLHFLHITIIENLQFIFISCWVFMFLLFWIWNVLNSISFRVTEDTRLFYWHRVPKRIVSTLMFWNLKFLKYQLSNCGFFRTNSDSLVFDSIYVYLYIHI